MKLILCSLLLIFLTYDNSFYGAPRLLFSVKAENIPSQKLTAMEALDLVKEQYAANFVKVNWEKTEDDPDLKETADEYYYKLSFADYYLVYEGRGQSDKEYLFHLYEYVMDEPALNLGHTVTYGWYTVNKETGTITDIMD